jgi:hypothetical protein
LQKGREPGGSGVADVVGIDLVAPNGDAHGRAPLRHGRRQRHGQLGRLPGAPQPQQAGRLVQRRLCAWSVDVSRAYVGARVGTRTDEAEGRVLPLREERELGAVGSNDEPVAVVAEAVQGHVRTL